MIENNYSEVPMEGEGKKKKLLLIIGGVVLLLLIIGGILFFVLRNSDENQDNQTSQNNGTSDVNSGQPVEDPFPGDKDRDGIQDEEEKTLGLSDQQFDTDSDGLSDVDELEVWKTDPKKFDTDNDSFGDGYEIVNGYDPLGSGKTTP